MKKTINSMFLWTYQLIYAFFAWLLRDWNISSHNCHIIILYVFVRYINFALGNQRQALTCSQQALFPSCEVFYTLHLKIKPKPDLPQKRVIFLIIKYKSIIY